MQEIYQFFKEHPMLQQILQLLVTGVLATTLVIIILKLYAKVMKRISAEKKIS